MDDLLQIILQDKNIYDIPILYVIKVVSAVIKAQEELCTNQLEKH